MQHTAQYVQLHVVLPDGLAVVGYEDWRRLAIGRSSQATQVKT
jgi:hypothetical protein